MKRLTIRGGIIYGIAGLISLTTAKAESGPCNFTIMGSAYVAAVRDGRTLLLNDGRELRLAGIETAANSKSALQDLVKDRKLRIEYRGADRDRYGRLFGFAFIEGAKQPLQASLLQQGAARVAARVGDKACADMLLSLEQAARNAHRGIWAKPSSGPLPASDNDQIKAEQGHFALIVGKVLSVHESGATIYLNFGRHWTRDFSATILRRLAPTFAAAGVDLKRLKGRRIRVRGWIEQRRGPIIALEAPEQIEFVD